MRTEYFVGLGFNRRGDEISEDLASEHIVQAETLAASLFGGCSTNRDFHGLEDGKPSERTLQLITAVDNQKAAESFASDLCTIFDQNSVFWFYGNEEHLTKNPDKENQAYTAAVNGLCPVHNLPLTLCHRSHQ